MDKFSAFFLSEEKRLNSSQKKKMYDAVAAKQGEGATSLK